MALPPASVFFQKALRQCSTFNKSSPFPGDIQIKKIIIAPDSFKGTLSSLEVCEVIEKVCRKYFPDIEIVTLPVADGGEGLVDAMLFACQGEKITAIVKDPLMRDVKAKYGILADGTAVIEMAAASGLPLLSIEERDVTKTTTFGTGQLIYDALKRGCRQFILGIGGSATNDGGAGMAAALGINFYDADGAIILTGGDLTKLERIDASNTIEGLREAKIKIACDVNNLLYGSNGAAYIYGPQKGATLDQVEKLDRGLANLSRIIFRESGIDLQTIPGTGAAGGMAVPLIVYAGAQISHGVDIVLDVIGFDEHLKNCDLIITGEGRSDSQSAMGKLVSGIGQRTKTYGIPVIAISGALHEGYEDLYQKGIVALFSTCREPCTLDLALKRARINLEKATDDLFRLIKALDLI